MLIVIAENHPPKVSPKAGDLSPQKAIDTAIEGLRYMMVNPEKFRKAEPIAKNVLRFIIGKKDLVARMKRDATWQRLVSVFKSKFHFDLEATLDGVSGAGLHHGMTVTVTAEDATPQQ